MDFDYNTQYLPLKTMAASIDESEELFHLLNGTDDQIKTYADLKPVPFPFQDESFVTTQEPYGQSNDYIDHDIQSTNPRDTTEHAHNGSIPTSTDFLAEKYDPEDQSAFDSQPICNQEFFSKLDTDLQNLPRQLYIDRLIEQTKNCDETISMYRNIIVNKARVSDKCPNGPLYARRNTKQESSSKRYANDCYALQSFIDNDDPRALTEIIAKRRTTVKSEPIDLTDHATPVAKISTTMKLELAELKSQILELKGTVNTLKSERNKDKHVIKELETCMQELKQDLITTKQLLEKQQKTHLINTPGTPSLFESIKRQKQKDEQQQQQQVTMNKTAAPVNGQTENVQSKSGQDSRQSTDKLNATDKISLDPKVDNKLKSQNCQSTSATTKTTKDSNLNDDKQNETKTTDNTFDGNYGAALKSNLKQTPNDNTNANYIDLTNESEPGQFGANSDLFVYIAENGRRRFGRRPKQNNTQKDDTSDSVTTGKQTHQLSYPDDHSHSEPRQIPVHQTNRFQHNEFREKNETKSHYQSRTIKHINQNQGYQNDNYKSTDTYSNEHNHSAEQPRFEGIIRRKTIRYYIGNIGSKSNRTGLIQFLKEYGIEPVGVRIIETNRGHLSAKITVFAADKYTIESCISWPKKTYCRRWYGVEQWNTRTENDNYDYNHYNDYGASSVD